MRVCVCAWKKKIPSLSSIDVPVPSVVFLLFSSFLLFVAPYIFYICVSFRRPVAARTARNFSKIVCDLLQRAC